MWVLLSGGLRRWLLLVVAVPLVTMVLRFLRVRVERRSGPTRVSRLIHRLERLGDRLSSRGRR